MDIHDDPAFRWLERGAGEPVVLLHGLMGQMQHWDAVLDTVDEGYRLIAPTLPVFHPDLHEASVRGLGRFVVRLLGGFAGLALVLAGIGLYGVMAYFVVERRREIAVRVALGATRAIVLEHVLGEALRLLAIGLVTGAIAAYFLTRLIANLLFGVGATDLPTHLVVFAVLGTVTVLASYLPARRAASIDPIAALRE